MATYGNQRRKLTPRQELFVHGLLEGKTAEQAHVDAGYKRNRGNAARLKAKESIRRRLAELRQPVIDAAQITLESHLQDLKILRNTAVAAKNYSAAVAAEVSRGKAAGLYVDRRVVNVKRIDEMSDDELRYTLGEKISAIADRLARTPPVGRA